MKRRPAFINQNNTSKKNKIKLHKRRNLRIMISIIRTKVLLQSLALSRNPLVESKLESQSFHRKTYSESLTIFFHKDANSKSSNTPQSWMRTCDVIFAWKDFNSMNNPQKKAQM